VETTSYNFADNAGSNNATICCPTLHQTAGGDGSFANPITLAVPGSGGSMQDPPGTRVYFVQFQFYGLVEDSGASPKSMNRSGTGGGPMKMEASNDKAMNRPAYIELSDCGTLVLARLGAGQ